MMMETLEVPINLRYATLFYGNTPKQLVVVLHGYGQLVSYFSKKFEGLDCTDTLFVFPEGRHRFYLKGHSGRVGASWMTSEWREEDIVINNNALHLLHTAILRKYPSIETTSVLGFSQGGATAARWVATKLFECKHFISWASVYPPDVPMEDFFHFAEKTSFVVGTEDEFFNDEIRNKLLSNYQQLGIQTVLFEGKHDIDLNILKQLL